MKRGLTAMFAVLTVVACANPAASEVATASSVAVQPGDLSGMVRCDLSGDINSYLDKIKTKDPSTYTSTKTQWETAQNNGATAAQVMFYTDTEANCASVESKVSNIPSASYKLVVNFVVQFKDEASAAAGYNSGSI